MSLSRTPTLLIVDDDQVLCEAVRDHYAAGRRFEVLVAHAGADALALCAKKRVDVVLLDQRLPDAEGHELCPSLLQCNDEMKIIFITAHPSFETALKALRAGAFDYLSKPFELQELDLATEKALRTIRLENIEELQNYRDERERLNTVLVGISAALAETVRLVELAAGADSPVLITGETGTGKNLVAAAIHYEGAARGKPFVSVNCAALPETLIEAEIFGHEKGAFTSAVSARRGMFEMADGGTLFLDEVGEIPLHLQAKLLTVLEEKKVRRLGGEGARLVDVRVIASTSVPIESVLGTSFRRDLYYRLNVLRLHLPPLRARREDIPALCEHLLGRLSGGAGIRLTDSEITQLQGYDWPGNIRELRNILERALILQRGRALRPSELLLRPADACAPAPSVHGESAVSLAEMEKRQISAMLAGGSRTYTQAAQALGISLSTLKRKIKEYGLNTRLPQARPGQAP